MEATHSIDPSGARRLHSFSTMIAVAQTARRYGCVVAVAVTCAACGASAPGFAQSSCGERGAPYIVDVPGDDTGGGWYDPGDPWVASGDDDLNGSPEDPGWGDTTNPGDDAPPDPTGSGDDSSGDDSGGDGADSVGVRVQSAAGTGARAFDGNICFSCPLTCTLSTATAIAGSTLGSSTTDFADACAHAESDLRRWAHRKYGARVALCHVVNASP